MTFADGALAAGASGSIAGALLASVASPGLRAPWLVLSGLLGALLAALAFWCFALLDLLILLFGDLSSPATALMLTLLVEGAAIASLVLSRTLQGRLQLPGSVDALLDSPPAGGPAQVWLAGVVVASVLIYFGIDCAVSARAMVGTTLWHHKVEGFPAVSYGIGWICAGLFAHFHYCWTRHPRLRGYSRTGKLVTMVVGMLSLTIAFYAAGIPIPPA